MHHYNPVTLLNFGLLCRIDSEHNRKVVEAIVQEIGTSSFSAKQIRGINL